MPCSQTFTHLLIYTFTSEDEIEDEDEFDKEEKPWKSQAHTTIR